MNLLFNQTNGMLIPVLDAVCECPVIRKRLKSIAAAMLVLNVVLILLLMWLPREEWPEAGKLMTSALIALNSGAFLAILMVRN